MIKFLLSLLFVLTSCSTFSEPKFISPTCSSSGGKINSAIYYVDLPPVIHAGEKYVLDLGGPKYQLTCWSDNPQHPFTMKPIMPTEIGPWVANDDRNLNWFGQVVLIPDGLVDMKKITLNQAHKRINAKFTYSFKPNTSLKKNDLLAMITFRFMDLNDTGNGVDYVYHFRVDKDIHVLGTCVPSTYNQNVTLNSYNPSKPSRKTIGLSVHCDQTTTVSYSLEGQLANSSDQSVFKNTAENGAKGIGIRFFNNGKKINKSEVQKIEIKGKSTKSLNLSADYGVVKGVPLSAGAVRSPVTVNLTYS